MINSMYQYHGNTFKMFSKFWNQERSRGEKICTDRMEERYVTLIIK